MINKTTVTQAKHQLLLAIIKHPEISQEDIKIAEHLINYYNPHTGYTIRLIQDIEYALKLPRRDVMKGIKFLEESGYFKVRRHKGTNRYIPQFRDTQPMLNIKVSLPVSLVVSLNRESVKNNITVSEIIERLVYYHYRVRD